MGWSSVLQVHLWSGSPVQKCEGAGIQGRCGGGGGGGGLESRQDVPQESQLLYSSRRQKASVGHHHSPPPCLVGDLFQGTVEGKMQASSPDTLWLTPCDTRSHPVAHLIDDHI